jgi:hypothetical protein
VHDYRDPDSAAAANEPKRFETNYRKAGGTIGLVVIEQETRTVGSIEPLIGFLRENLHT